MYVFYTLHRPKMKKYDAVTLCGESCSCNHFIKKNRDNQQKFHRKSGITKYNVCPPLSSTVQKCKNKHQIRTLCRVLGTF